MSETQLASMFIGSADDGDGIERGGPSDSGNMIHIVNPQTSEILDYITLDNIIDDSHKKSLESYLETYDAIVLGGDDFSYDKHLEKRNHIIIPDEDGTYQEFVLFEVEKYRDTEGRKTHFYAHATYLELKKAKVIYPTRREGLTLSQHAGWALNNTGWRVGIVESEGVRTFNIENHTNPYEFIKRIANEFEVEIRFRVEHDGRRITARYVDFLERIGDWKGREVEFGRDLDSIRRIEKQDVVTALLGLGPEREDGTRLEVLVEDEEALRRWGRVDEHGNLHHLIEPYEIQSERTEMTEEEARRYTRTALDKRINTQVTYETTILDLEEVPGLEHEKIRFGDTIRIKDTYFNPPLYLEARVFEIERSIKNKAKKDIKLGDYIEYTEEEISAIWNQLRNEIRRRLDRMAIVTINSTAGNIFKNAQGETELTARTFVSGAERDEDGTLYDYQWMRFDKDGNHDTNFYAEGKTITVTANDIDEKATYRVLVAYELEVINTAEITISNVFDGEDGEPGPPGPNRVDENTEFGEGYNPIEKATPEDIDEAIDNLEIGGRNLLLNTPSEEVESGDFPGWSSDYYNVSSNVIEELKKGGTYTMSVYFTHTESNNDSRFGLIFMFIKSPGVVESQYFSYESFINSGEKGWSITTIEIPDKSANEDIIGARVYIRSDNPLPTSESGKKVRYKWVKLEKGHKATDWTPAPEDVQAEIDEAKQDAEEAKQEAQQAQTTADGKNTIIFSATEPSTEGRKIGDTWFDTSRDNLMHRFNGIEWVEAKWGEQSIVANSITANHIKSLDGLNVNDQFIVDSQGNVKFAGRLEGATGSFSGTIEASEIIGSSFFLQEGSGNFSIIPLEVKGENSRTFSGVTREGKYLITWEVGFDQQPLPQILLSEDRFDEGSVVGRPNVLKIRPSTIIFEHNFGPTFDDFFTFDMDKARFTGSVEIDSFSNPLWTGALYPLDTHTIVPTKKITECLTGWVLEWSRYVPGTGESNVQYSYSYVPKASIIRNPGASRSFQIPRDINQAFWKYLYIYEDQIVGHANNSGQYSNGVVLRAVYEY